MSPEKIWVVFDGYWFTKDNEKLFNEYPLGARRDKEEAEELKAQGSKNAYIFEVDLQ